jgi:hypothetical protein
MLYPCKDCLVEPICSDKYIDYLAFVNGTADNLGKMSADEIAYIIREVPLKVRRKIQQFVSEKVRYAFERQIEVHVYQKGESSECSDTLVRLA